jgi:hypothetical protein
METELGVGTKVIVRLAASTLNGERGTVIAVQVHPSVDGVEPAETWATVKLDRWGTKAMAVKYLEVAA